MLYGFIGCGNMGAALARALRRNVDGSQVLLSNRSPDKARVLASELNCTYSNNETVAEQADTILLGVKPHMMAGVLLELTPILEQRAEKPLLVSMAAGLTIQEISRMAGDSCPILRIMPNTPAAVGAGMILYTPGPGVEDAYLDRFLADFTGAGRFCVLTENLMDAGSAVSGCGPAFADLFVEALADGGVLCGLPRAKAQELAAQMLLGSAKLLLESGQHPGLLKDAVCSPGGTTIEGVRALEEGAFRATVMNAVIAAFEKTKKLK